eukprot:gene29597-38168_t
MDTMGFGDKNYVQEDLEKAASALGNSDCIIGVSDLKSNFEGNVFLPSDADTTAYNEIRSSVYNRLCRGYPFVITQPKSTSDVVKVIEFKKKYGSGVPLCVSGGKHGNFSMLNNSIVIDMSLLSDVVVDGPNKLITIGGGTPQGKLDAEAAKFGLVVSGPVKPEISYVGWAVYGGYGYLSRYLGTGADQIIEVEVVLASGTVVTATDSNEFADLLNGIRGAGPNFGIITKLKLRASVLPPVIIGGIVVYMTPTTASKTATLIEFDKLAQ